MILRLEGMRIPAGLNPLFQLIPCWDAAHGVRRFDATSADCVGILHALRRRKPLAISNLESGYRRVAGTGRANELALAERYGRRAHDRPNLYTFLIEPSSVARAKIKPCVASLSSTALAPTGGVSLRSSSTSTRRRYQARGKRDCLDDLVNARSKETDKRRTLCRISGQSARAAADAGSKHTMSSDVRLQPAFWAIRNTLASSFPSSRCISHMSPG